LPLSLSPFAIWLWRLASIGHVPHTHTDERRRKATGLLCMSCVSYKYMPGGVGWVLVDGCGCEYELKYEL
jgi:hypothetical protein